MSDKYLHDVDAPNVTYVPVPTVTKLSKEDVDKALSLVEHEQEQSEQNRLRSRLREVVAILAGAMELEGMKIKTCDVRDWGSMNHYEVRINVEIPVVRA